MKNKILRLLVNDHEQILRLIHELRNSNSDVNSVKKSFRKFRKKFEQHLIAEEKLVKNFYKSKGFEEANMVSRMFSEHKELLNELSRMNDELRKGFFDLKRFNNLLLEHKTFEEDFFYPKLDVELG